jgi:hypothetical protein
MPEHRIAQRVRITNFFDQPLVVCLEPIAEERSIPPGESIYVTVELESGQVSYSNILEFQWNIGRVTIFYTQKSTVDWAEPAFRDENL